MHGRQSQSGTISIIAMRFFLQLVYILSCYYVLHGAIAQDCFSDGKLCDTHERCSVWKSEGECIRNLAYMKKYCPVSCSDETLTTTKAASLAKDCEDAHPKCEIWSMLGECEKNDEMESYCAKSCNTCDNAIDDISSLCRDKHENCRKWANRGECDTNPRYMHVNCALSCGTCAEFQGKRISSKKDPIPQNDLEIVEASAQFGLKQTAKGTKASATLEVIQKSIEYMSSNDVNTLPETFRDECRNKHDLCSFWAAVGECENNQSFMKINCAPACLSCHLINMKARCPPLPDDTEPALRPGSLNTMFERIISTAPGNLTNPSQKLQGVPEYTVHVLSSPGETAMSSPVSLYFDKTYLPWVLTFDNFMTPEECDKMIELGYKEGYQRSKDVGKQKVDGTVDGKESKGRTSENAWCTKRNGCRQDPLAEEIHSRISKVLGIPSVNSEDFQILRYEVGQFYNQHHDYIPKQKYRQCGPRILTFFIYLSDVEEGGGTDFPMLGITVSPKKGSAVLWPSVYNAEPINSDPRMEHQALPVIKGIKFAMNAWVHMYDYVGPQSRGCN